MHNTNTAAASLHQANRLWRDTPVPSVFQTDAYLCLPVA